MLKDMWTAAAEQPLLKEDEVHVWRAHLGALPTVLETLFESLSTDERQRAGRFHFRKDCDRFIIARGVLRQILSRYLNTSPAQLRFSYTEYGKPELQDVPGKVPVRFNMSHSNEMALYAVTLGREIGIDVEFIREDFAGIEIAERFFSTAEVAVLRALPSALQTPAFFNCWTRKEAYIKARGEGLSYPLDQFTVSLTPGEPACLLSTHLDPRDAERWKLFALSPADGYVGALAVEGVGLALRYLQQS